MDRVDGSGCHHPLPLAPCILLVLSRSQLGTQADGEGATIMCPGTVIVRVEGGVDSELLLTWPEAAPLAWIQLP